MKFEIERVFPVYAMGSSKPSAPLTAVASDLGDPIWDAVREEAKLDVIAFSKHPFSVLLR